MPESESPPSTRPDATPTPTRAGAGTQSLLKLSKQLDAIIEKGFEGKGSPDEFVEWCKDKFLLSAMDIALLAPDENKIEEKLLKACQGDVACATEIHGEVAIRKIWHYCREALKSPTTESASKTLDPEDMKDLNMRWIASGGITLSTRERVCKTLMKKMHSMVISDPIEFEITLLEQISVLAKVPKVVDQLVKIVDGTVAFQAQQVQATTSAFEVVEKIKAYLFSLSYVSCVVPDWCTFAQVRVAVEEIGVKIQAAERHSAPMSFYNDAYLAMMQTFQQKIIVEGDTMTVALGLTGAWLHFWNYQCPGCVRCTPGYNRGKGGQQQAALAVDGSLRQQRRTMQNSLWNTLTRFNKGQGKGRGKGNGKNAGKGNQQRNWQVNQQQFQKMDKGGNKGGSKGGKGKGKGKGKPWW